MKQFALCFLQDSHGNYSHARLIAVLVGISATLFMWKLMVMSQMTIDYFIWYLGYGVVHQNLNKVLDVVAAWLGIRKAKDD